MKFSNPSHKLQFPTAALRSTHPVLPKNSADLVDWCVKRPLDSGSSAIPPSLLLASNAAHVWQRLWWQLPHGRSIKSKPASSAGILYFECQQKCQQHRSTCVVWILLLINKRVIGDFTRASKNCHSTGGFVACHATGLWLRELQLDWLVRAKASNPVRFRPPPATPSKTSTKSYKVMDPQVPAKVPVKH